MTRPRDKEKVRYRRVSLRMWNDQKFLELSDPKPSGKVLWIWLLTGPRTTPVPGVVLTTMSGMAERLGWSLAATRKCWDEIASRGMATADWSLELVWLRRALLHNPPESPNVVKSWRRYLDEHVPECGLRAEIEREMRFCLEALGEGFREAFGEGMASSFRESGNREQGTDTKSTAPAALVSQKSSTWKRSIAIAHAVMDECPDSQDWTPEFKARCSAQGINYGQPGGETQRPLFARALDYVERQRAQRQRRTH